MKYKIEQIIADVRMAMGIGACDPAAVISLPSHQQDLPQLIASHLEFAAAQAIMEAEPMLLWPGTPLDADIHWHRDECWGAVQLPRDFLRLLIFEMDDWTTPAFTTITPTDTAYQLQRSEWPGIRGSWQRPVVALVNRPEGLTLEFYSCRSRRAKIKRASYIPSPAIDHCGTIDIPQGCYHAVIETLTQKISPIIA